MAFVGFSEAYLPMFEKGFDAKKKKQEQQLAQLNAQANMRLGAQLEDQALSSEEKAARLYNKDPKAYSARMAANYPFKLEEIGLDRDKLNMLGDQFNRELLFKQQQQQQNYGLDKQELDWKKQQPFQQQPDKVQGFNFLLNQEMENSKRMNGRTPTPQEQQSLYSSVRDRVWAPPIDYSGF